MKSFLALAKARKTTYEFTDKTVRDEDLKKILEAGRWAPSCSNTQPWNFVVVKDKERVAELVKTANYIAFHTSPALIIAQVLVQNLCRGPNHACFRNLKSQTYDTHMSIAMSALNMVYEAALVKIS